MSITVEKINVLSFVVTGAERLDPVRVMIENIEPGRGQITIVCFGRSWNTGWGAMSGGTVQDFIKRVSNDYLIGCLAPRLRSTIDDDNDANVLFVKRAILQARRDEEIDSDEARNAWEEAECADDVKSLYCEYGVANFGFLGDEPWHAKWPTVPNPELWHAWSSCHDALLDELQAKDMCIAELEARTVRVELPALRDVSMMSDYSHNEAIIQCRGAFEVACHRAGIKCEVV